jgi:hypothetical protein
MGKSVGAGPSCPPSKRIDDCWSSTEVIVIVNCRNLMLSYYCRCGHSIVLLVLSVQCMFVLSCTVSCCCT